MKIYLGLDHRGIAIKEELYNYIKSLGYDVELSNIPNNPTDDYPDFAYDVANKVVHNNGLGVLVCGSGIGVSIAANKVKGIKCGKVDSEADAHQGRFDDGMNCIAFSASIPMDDIKKIIATFIATTPSTAERHIRRQQKVDAIERGTYEY